MIAERIFASRDQASGALADHIAKCLTDRLNCDGQATIVVSGGTTPQQCFRFLSRKNLDWSRVQIALSDERCVPNDHPDSNESLLRENLLLGAAKSASIVPVYRDGMSVEERCDALQSQRPAAGFDCVMLGMGEDGHFASLFPDADALACGLDAKSERFYIPIRTTASPHARVSMTLGALLHSREILLLIFGAAKHAIFERAKAGDQSLPIAALLAQHNVAVTCYWAP